MSQRERWTIYPLLFFALLLGLKSQLPGCNDTAHFRQIECRELRVVDPDGQPVIDMQANPQGQGYINVYGADRSERGQARLPKVKLSVSSETQAGVVEARSAQGTRMVEMTGNQSGGAVIVYDNLGRPKPVVVRLRQVNPPNPPTAQPLPPDAGGALGSENPRNVPVRPPVPPGEASDDAADDDAADDDATGT